MSTTENGTSVAPRFDQLSVGDQVAEHTIHFSRDALVRYAGASGDFNPIHYRDDVAIEVGLPGVLAHGMLTMGAAVAPVTEWIGAAGWVKDYQARFTRPVLVAPDADAEVVVTAVVATLDVDAQTARVDLTVVFAEKTVLGKCQVLVQFT